MSALFKQALRMFKRQKSRLISLISICFVSVGFVSGLFETVDVIQGSLNQYLLDYNTSDIILKSKNQYGFNEEDIKKIEDLENIKYSSSTTIEIKDNEDIIRLSYIDFDSDVNKLDLIEGNLPSNENEILVERDTKLYRDYKVNDEIKINDPLTNQEVIYKVSGIVIGPLNLGALEEPSFQYSGKNISQIFYIKKNNYLPITDINICINRNVEIFSDEYNDLINSYIEKIDIENMEALTFEENYGIKSMYEYGNKIYDISIIFIAFFMLVTGLVVLSTMTRLLEEERTQIACLVTQGYSGFKIMLKYLIFAFIATILGGIIGLFVGKSLVMVLYDAFGSNYTMPPMISPTSYIYFILTVLLILVAVLFVTWYTGFKMLKNRPAELLRPVAPKSGKKVLLERISFVWNRLSFRYKSSFRNVFRYKKHFFMTVISIMGSTILVFAGLGVLDVSRKDSTIDTLFSLALILVIFAGLLTALVIYNLTNINISERNREIATLMVLGYYDKEVSLYIFREIIIMSVIGAILGIPFGALLLDFIFDFIGFGGMDMVNKTTFVLAPFVTLIFTIIVCLILYRKVVKIDMNESLKARE